MTVEIKSQKSKAELPENQPKAPDLRDIVNIDPLQQGQALLAARKKRKKQQKRAGLYKRMALEMVTAWKWNSSRVQVCCLYIHFCFIMQNKMSI